MLIREIYLDPTSEDNLNPALSLIPNAQAAGRQLIIHGTQNSSVINATRVFSKAK